MVPNKNKRIDVRAKTAANLRLKIKKIEKRANKLAAEAEKFQKLTGGTPKATPVKKVIKKSIAKPKKLGVREAIKKRKAAIKKATKGL